MRFQCLPYSCGAAAIVNVLRAFGGTVSESRVRRLADTTPDGTDAPGIMAALRSLGLTASEFRDTDAAKAWLMLHGAISRGRAAIIATDSDEHWVACVGALGERIVVVDSGRVRDNLRENGVHMLGRRQLIRRWVGIEEYYGISAGRQ